MKQQILASLNARQHWSNVRISRLVSILVIVLVGCSAASDAPQSTREEAELDEAVETWASRDRSDYSYIYLRTCKCDAPEPQGPNTVFVIDGSVAHIEHFGSREALDGFSADELFKRIRQAISEGHEIAVVYDPATGLPSSLNLDLRAGPDDDPLILDIRSFLSYADHRATLANARLRWDTASVADYQIHYDTQLTGQVEVEVRNGLAIATDEPDLLGRTVTDFFDEIAAAIAGRPDSIAIEYDPDLGYPISYRIEQQSDRKILIQYESINVTQ